MQPNPQVDSALHVLKGSVQKILGATLTTSVHAQENRGRLCVEFGTKPSQEEIADIENLANSKISQNVPIETFEMERKAAEEKFGNVIYDKFLVPAHITKLKIVRIQDWNINCCIGKHVERTGQIGTIKITDWRSRPNRKELEISFEML